MHHDGGRSLGGTLDPEGAEVGKLLALGIGGVERKPARRETVREALRDRAEIARAEKHADFIEVVRAVDWPMDTQARKADIRLDVRHGLIAEGEHGRGVDDGRSAPVLYLENVYAVGVIEAAMEELELERQIVVTPEGMVRLKADHAVAVIS